MPQVGNHVRVKPPFNTAYSGVYLVDAVKADGTVVIMGSRDFAPAHVEVTPDPLTSYAYVSEQGEGVPEKISAAQAMAVLDANGLLDAAEALVNDPATPKAVKIFWNREHEFNRDSPALNAMAAQMGLSPQQIDALFIAAAQIRV